MSIRVTPVDLSEHLAGRPFAYVVSAGESGPKVVAQVCRVTGSQVRVADVGRGTAANIERDPHVTLVWPPVDSPSHDLDRYSLIADGVASVDDDDGRSDLVIEVSGAILHRPAV